LGISDGEDRNAHRNQATFGNGFDFQRQITQVMQCLDMIIGDAILTQVVINSSFIAIDNFGFGLIEEAIIKLSNQIFQNEILKSEEYDFLDFAVPGFTGSKIRIYECGAFGVLKFVTHFVAIFKDKG
jgi:hypothetical protein